MRKYFIPAVVIFLLSESFIGQTYGQKSKTKIQIKEKNTGSYPIAGSDLLSDQYIKTAQFLEANPDYFSQAKLKKTTAWNFNVGSKRYWTAVNFTNNSEYTVNSTCKAVGTHCYVFVADDVWGNYVDSNAVLAVVNDFDNQTRSDPNKGIYQTDVDTFGDPPDVDNDPRIIILILDIQDNYSGSGGYIAGYFSPSNETRGGGQAAEIYFMDSNPTDLKTSEGLTTALSTAAHEFQHMINWNYHKTKPELTFINEGLSMSAEVVCGYGVSMQTLYANEPNHYLFDWRGNDETLVLNDYARAQRFFLYIMEQFGIGSLKQIVQDNTTFGLVGISGLSKILSNYYSTSLGQVFLNWEIANGLNNTNVSPAYGYTQSGISVTTGTKFFNPNISLTSSTLQNLGAEYFTYSKSANLSITFSSTGNNIIVKALEIGTGSSRVIDVPMNSSFSEPDYPDIYNTIRFAAIDTNLSSTQPYQYQSSGTAENSVTEVKWDRTEPTGYYVWTTNDTVCVTFDSLSGGKLDSIRIALRRPGSITGGVWEYSGKEIPTPLGKKLAFPITASINTETPVPYPVPYKNWATVDLSSYDISTDKPFAVGFIIGSDPRTPGVMVTDMASTGAYHSYTYLQTSDGVSSPDWYYITTNNIGDTIAIYLIRAYVSLNNTQTTKTLKATNITTNSATLNGVVNPNNLRTEVYFQYGTSSTYGDEVPAIQNPINAGTNNVDVSADITGLQLSTTYHFRAQAININNDTTYGSDVTFATAGAYPDSITLNKTFTFNDLKKDSYRMIGLPGNINLPINNFMTGKQKEDWDVYYDDGSEPANLLEYNGEDIFNFTPGKGFWVLSKNPIIISSQQVGTVNLTGTYFSIGLHNGWNIISNPFEKNVNVSDIRTANNLAQNSVFFNFDGSFPAGGSSVLIPYEGYYFYNDSTRQSLKIPYPFSSAISKSQYSSFKSSESNDYLKLSLLQNKLERSYIIVGFNSFAKKDYDKFDFLAPPNFFDKIRIEVEDQNLSIPYKHLFIDYRPAINEGQKYELKIRNSTNGNLDLLATGLDNFKNDEVFLVDDSLNQFYNLKNKNEINISPGNQNKSYGLLIGNKDFINNYKQNYLPAYYNLSQNYPNPFNPTTTIDFQIPNDGFVSLKVYDILGNEVKILVNEFLKKGRYKKEFNASGLASGIYFYELSTGGYNAVKKLMLLK